VVWHQICRTSKMLFRLMLNGLSDPGPVPQNLIQDFEMDIPVPTDLMSKIIPEL